MKFRPLFLIPLFPLLSLENQAAPLTLTGSAGNLLVSGSGATAVTGNSFADGDTISYTGTPSAAFTVSVTGNIIPGAVSLANTTNTITFGGTNTVTGTTYTKTGTGAVYFNTGMSFSGGISTGSGFTSTSTASTGNGLVSQTGTLASLELFSLTSDAYNLAGDITLTNTANANVLAFGGLGSGVNAAKSLSNNITLSSSAVQSRFVILGDATTSTAQAGKHDVVLSGKISGGITGATFFVNTDQGSLLSASSLKLTNATNDFIANIQVNRGGLAITTDAALGNAANNVTIDVNNTGGGMRFDAALTSARTYTFTVNEAVDTNGNDVTLSGVVAGGGTILKKSTGTLTLSGASSNTFSNTLTIGAGTVKLGKASALGTTAGGTIVNSGAVLDLNAQAIGAEAVTLNGTGISSGGALINSSATAASLSGAVTLGSNASVGGTGNTTLSGAVTGAFTLTKSGSGTLTLSNSGNSHLSTSISGGRIAIGSASNIGTGAIAFTTVGTGLEITGTAVTLTNNISLPTSGSGNITLLTANNSSTVLNGTISGGGSGTVLYFQGGGQSQNSGALTLNGTNTFSGAINVQRGPLILGNSNAAGTAAIILDSNSPPAGALQLGNFSIANNLQLVGGASVGVATGNSATIGGTISGSAAFTKLGSGTLTLTNTNTYTGVTNITTGTLALSGTASLASSNITVGTGTTFDVSGVTGGYTITSGKTLSGTGSVSGNVTIAGIHSPGTSPGLQTFTGDLSYASTATLNIELVGDTLGVRGTDYDGIDLTGGDLSINPAATFNLITSAINYAAAAWDVDRSFTIIDLTGGSFSGGPFNLNTSSAGSFASEGSWSLGSVGGDVMLNWTAVPEPGAALLGGIGLLALLRRRR